MVKFTKSDLDNYQKVRYVLQSFVGRATTVIQKRMQNVYGMAHHFDVPHAKSSF